MLVNFGLIVTARWRNGSAEGFGPSRSGSIPERAAILISSLLGLS